jgi:hypothetical protein
VLKPSPSQPLRQRLGILWPQRDEQDSHLQCLKFPSIA